MGSDLGRAYRPFGQSDALAEGHPSLKEDQMFRNTLYVRFCLLLLLLVAVAMFLGSEPWGPT